MYQPELGPGSLLWRWAGDTRIAFMGGAIGLLQLMHPAIGAGVLQHSNFFDDPFDRVFRSLPEILGAVYDEDAEGTGRRIRDYHRDIKGVDDAGRRYHALDPATFWWAHATFQYMAEQVADRWDSHRLTPAERERLYLEGVEWYRRYGVSDRCVPPDRASYQLAWDRVCGSVLERNDAVDFVLEMLEGQRVGRVREIPGVPKMVMPVVRNRHVRRVASYPSRLAAIGGLPPVVRERFDIPWTARDERDLARLQWAVRRGWRLVPDAVAWQPRARAGRRRVKAA
jgi:uncharacterized protein (DUF2236 family)